MDESRSSQLGREQRHITSTVVTGKRCRIIEIGCSLYLFISIVNALVVLLLNSWLYFINPVLDICPERRLKFASFYKLWIKIIIFIAHMSFSFQVKVAKLSPRQMFSVYIFNWHLLLIFPPKKVSFWINTQLLLRGKNMPWPLSRILSFILIFLAYKNFCHFINFRLQYFKWNDARNISLIKNWKKNLEGMFQRNYF